MLISVFMTQRGQLFQEGHWIPIVRSRKDAIQVFFNASINIKFKTIWHSCIGYYEVVVSLCQNIASDK